MKATRKALWSALLISVMLISACSNDPAPGVDEPSEPPPGQIDTQPEETPDPEAEDEALIKAFRDLKREAEGPETLIAFLDENLAEAGEEAANTLFLELEAYYAEDLPRTQGAFLTNEVQEKFSIMGDPTSAANITDSELRELALRAEAGHYVLIQTDGEVYPIIDYASLEKYNPYLTQEFSDYLHLRAMNAERVKAAQPDSASTLVYAADWAVTAEQYLDRYPEGYQRDEVLEEYAGRMEFLLFGMAGGPRFDLDNGVIYDDYMQTFQLIAQQHADTYTGSLVQRFVELLASSDQKLIIVSATDRRDVPEIAEFRDGLIEHIHEQYGESEELEEE